MIGREVAQLLSKGRFRLGNEYILQADIATYLEDNGVTFTREVMLGVGERIDFIVEHGIGIEVKARASKRHIFRQLSRYAEHDRITDLILISNTAIGLPPLIGEKPVYLVSLGRCAL